MFLNALLTKCGVDNSLANPNPNDNPVKLEAPLLNNSNIVVGLIQA
jgi:hypothetical protein